MKVLILSIVITLLGLSARPSQAEDSALKAGSTYLDVAIAAGFSSGSSNSELFFPKCGPFFSVRLRTGDPSGGNTTITFHNNGPASAQEAGEMGLGDYHNPVAGAFHWYDTKLSGAIRRTFFAQNPPYQDEQNVDEFAALTSEQKDGFEKLRRQILSSQQAFARSIGDQSIVEQSRDYWGAVGELKKIQEICALVERESRVSAGSGSLKSTDWGTKPVGSSSTGGVGLPQSGPAGSAR